MQKHLLIAFFSLISSLHALAQLGNPFIQSFTPSDYQSNAYISSPQNWGIIQDNRGIMYVSNTSGVLEYDGISWQLVKGTSYGGRFQLARNSEGQLFVGSLNNFGYLAPDSAGRMEFVSLLPAFKGQPTEIRINKVVTEGRDVYFNTADKLYRWSGGRMTSWSSEAGFTRIFESNNRIYVLDKGIGLAVLQHGQLFPLPGGEALKGLNVTALIPLKQQSQSLHDFVVVTFDDGLFTFREDVLDRLSPTPGNILEGTAFMHAVQLSDSTIALATTSEGVVVMDQEGIIRQVINKQKGLNDNTVIHLSTDREGGLWASLNIGISRIDYPSPISYLNENAALDGIVLDILKHNTLLYAGTSSGLYVAQEDTPNPEFRKFPQLQNEVWKLLPAGGDTVLVVCSTGIYTLLNNQLQQLSPESGGTVFKTIIRSRRHPSLYFVGSSDGVWLLRRQTGKWRWEGKVKQVMHDVIWLAEDRDGLLWASADHHISTIDVQSDSIPTLAVSTYKPSEELVKKLNRFQASSINGKIYFGTSKGIYSIRREGKKLLLKPDTSFGKRFANGTREAINLTQGQDGKVWLTSEFSTGVFKKVSENGYVWDTIPLSRIPRVDVWAIHTDRDGVVWLGTTEGIFRYNPEVPKNYGTRQQTVLRKVKLLGDSTVFFGAFGEQGKPIVNQTKRFRFVLPHAVKSISFEYAATSYDAPDQLLYSYMLEGEDKTWSHWTSETKKEFTGLDEGTYVFKVRSKNIYGTVNLASTFEFVSLPPFYRTWWAYTLYVLLYGLVIWGIVKIKHRHLITTQKGLEKLVHERTAELEAEKKKSDDLLLNILPAKTAEELKANGRTLARSYKNVTVLFTDFKNFTQISEHLTPEELVAVIDFYFCAFDRIISNYNIEKIKTIGDAYMCAGGIPNPSANTPADVVKAALEIVQFVNNLNPNDSHIKKHKFEIRVGIHTGPVVAGIVGTTKFAYDIWGDTVNTAARMESCGEEGKVNISGATYEIIKDDFQCTYRGRVDAKNKGEIDMYFVEGEVSEQAIMHSAATQDA
ncbi:adenylate/guanylate cyclase domain-containing protein [Pontibacter sp. CAU 1760]